jgi:hypothetical protein
MDEVRFTVGDEVTIQDDVGKKVGAVVLGPAKKKEVKYEMWTIENVGAQEKLALKIGNHYSDYAVIAALKSYLTIKTRTANCSNADISRAIVMNRHVVSRALTRLEKSEIIAWYETRSVEGWIFNPLYLTIGSYHVAEKMWQFALEKAAVKADEERVRATVNACIQRIEDGEDIEGVLFSIDDADSFSEMLTTVDKMCSLI